jgi:hypothetical protein
VWVKRGTQTAPGHHLPAAAYARHNLAAVHLSPAEARQRIRKAARRAVERARREDFGLLRLAPPYERVTVLRCDESNPPRVSRNQHPTSIIHLFRTSFDFKPIPEADPLRFAGGPPA